MLATVNSMPENIAVFGNCNSYNLLKVPVTRCCTVSFGNVACIIHCWFLVDHLAVPSFVVGFLESMSVRGFSQYPVCGILAWKLFFVRLLASILGSRMI